MPGAKKVITLSVSAALIASMIGITGCGDRDNGNGIRTNNTRYGAADTNRMNRFGVNSTDMGNGLGRNGAGNQNLDNMRYSPDLSRRISEMNGIRNANVLVNDNSAYVAVSLEGQRGTNATTRERTTDMGNMGVRGSVGTRAPYTTSGIAPGLTGNNNGTAPGNRGSMADDNGLTGTSGTGTFGLMRGMMNNNNGGMLDGTDTGAYTGRNTAGMGTGRNGMGATGGTTSLPRDIRNRISNKIKQYAPQIEHVYVSNDPDFVTRMGGYARDLGNGQPFNEMRDDFRTMVDRLFPGGTGMDGAGPQQGTMNRGNTTIGGNR